MTRRWSLRTRFVLAALVCLLPLSGVSLYILLQSLEPSIDQLVDAEQGIVRVVASGINDRLLLNEKVLSNLATNEAVRRRDIPATEAAFQNAWFYQPNLLGFFLVDPTGELLVPPPLDIDRIRADLTPVLESTFQRGETAVSDRLSIGDSEVVVMIAPVWETVNETTDAATGASATGSPAAESDEVGTAAIAPTAPIAAVGALLAVEQLGRTFTPFTNEQTEIAVVSADQVIFSSGASEGDSLTVRLAEPIGLALDGATGTYTYEDAGGDERVAVYAPIGYPTADWAVVVSAPSPSTYQSYEMVLQQGLVALAVAVLITLALALVFGEVTARPMRQLTAQAAALAEGNFTQRIEPTGGGEVRSLSIAFREMEDRLADQVRDLETARQVREQQAAELRELNRRTVRLQEEERRRIAADIHDAVSPLITGALYQTRAVRLANGSGEPADRDAALDAAAELLERAGTELHGVIFALRPPDLDDIGVVAAIERYMAGIQRHGLSCRLEITGEPPSLTPEARLGIYRIVQEALHNVVRHAGADEAVVRIEATPALLRVVVRDNGSGFDPERARGGTSLGILSMRERAAAIGATVEIASRPGGGTVVVIERPNPGAPVTEADAEAAEAAAEAAAAEAALGETGATRRPSRRYRNGRAQRPLPAVGTARPTDGATRPTDATPPDGSGPTVPAPAREGRRP